MGKIVFFIDEEEGHYLPTISFARSLVARGHSVSYWGIKDCAPAIHQFGFPFITLDEKNYPSGYQLQRKHKQEKNEPIVRLQFFEQINGEIKKLINRTAPDVIVVSTYLSLDALLIHKAFSVPVLIFTPYLLPDSFPRMECWKTIANTFFHRKGEQLQKVLHRYRLKAGTPQEINDLALILDKLPEVVACPDDFDAPYNSKRNNRHFIGPSIRNSNHSLPPLQFPDNRKVIYVSMGSQLSRIKDKGEQLYAMLIEIMEDKEMLPYHLVLSGGGLEQQPFNSKPNERISYLTWVPQMEMLEKACLMITHGGLGTVKECIRQQVPMIVIPLQYDQPINAARVEHHQLGISLPFEGLAITKLKEVMLQAIHDPLIKQALRTMKHKFIEKEKLQFGEMIVEELIQKNIKHLSLVSKIWRRLSRKG